MELNDKEIFQELWEVVKEAAKLNTEQRNQCRAIAESQTDEELKHFIHVVLNAADTRSTKKGVAKGV